MRNRLLLFLVFAVPAVVLGAENFYRPSGSAERFAAVRDTSDQIIPKVAVVSTDDADSSGLIVRSIDDLDETKKQIKATAGRIYKIHAVNRHATDARYLKVYGLPGASVTVGTTGVVMDLAIPPNYGGFIFDLGGAANSSDGTTTTAFTGITVAAGTTFGSTSIGTPGTNDVMATIIFK